MANTSNIIIFSVVIFFAYGLALALDKLFGKMPLGGGILRTVLGLAFVGGAIILYYYVPSHGKVEDFGSLYGPNVGAKDTGLLEVTPAKKCCLWGKNEPGCEHIPQEVLDCYCCKNGMCKGRPVHFEYTPQSDRTWSDNRCKDADDPMKCAENAYMPSVL